MAWIFEHAKTQYRYVSDSKRVKVGCAPHQNVTNRCEKMDSMGNPGGHRGAQQLNMRAQL